MLEDKTFCEGLEETTFGVNCYAFQMKKGSHGRGSGHNY